MNRVRRSEQGRQAPVVPPVPVDQAPPAVQLALLVQSHLLVPLDQLPLSRQAAQVDRSGLGAQRVPVSLGRRSYCMQGTATQEALSAVS